MKDALKHAIKCGYRHIDTAYVYLNEDVIGRTLKEVIDESNGTLKREDFFLVSKVWCTHHSKQAVRQALQETLKNLQTDYLDLYLIHFPMGFKVDCFILTMALINVLCLNRKALVNCRFPRMTRGSQYFPIFVIWRLSRPWKSCIKRVSSKILA